MCDTLGIVGPHGALFGKNSDRSANEPQVLEWYQAGRGGGTVRATYIDVEQPAETLGFLLSRPVWMWGGEMGVNEAGVCIGNEAVFTKGRYAKSGLLGMDMLRLALGQAATAAQAVEALIGYLERYGQGGNAGYDHDFAYDNSFLVMDATKVHILETAGRDWVVKQVRRGSISNRLTIGTDGDRYSGGTPVDFARRHADPVFTFFSGSAKRLGSTRGCLAGEPDVAGLFSALRMHTHDWPPLRTASVASPCMHAGGLIGDHTTASLVVQMTDNRTVVWATGASTPCISLFKPSLLGQVGAPVFAAGDRADLEYWLAREHFHRAAIGCELPPEFYAERDAIEAGWLASAREADASKMAELTAEAFRQESHFFNRWAGRLPVKRGGSARFRRYWARHTAVLNDQAQNRYR